QDDHERRDDVAGSDERIQAGAREEEEPDVGLGRDANLTDDGDDQRPETGAQAAEDDTDDDRFDDQHRQDEAALRPDGPQRSDLLDSFQGGHHQRVIDDDQRDEEDDQNRHIEDGPRDVDELTDEPGGFLPVNRLERQSVLLTLGLD